MRIDLSAALIFSDREYSEMLIYELMSCGFKIAKNENDADIILTEEEFLPYIKNEKTVIVFMRYGVEDPERDGKTFVFPYIFSSSDLRKKLKDLFAELVYLPSKETTAFAGDKIEILALPDKKTALVAGEIVMLSSTEWKMLYLLTRAAEKGREVSREELSKAIGHDSEKGGNIVDVYICRLRKKIEFPIGRRLIFTVRGLGYSLIKEGKDEDNEKRI